MEPAQCLGFQLRLQFMIICLNPLIGSLLDCNTCILHTQTLHNPATWAAPSTNPSNQCISRCHNCRWPRQGQNKVIPGLSILPTTGESQRKLLLPAACRLKVLAAHAPPWHSTFSDGARDTVYESHQLSSSYQGLQRQQHDSSQAAHGRGGGPIGGSDCDCDGHGGLQVAAEQCSALSCRAGQVRFRLHPTCWRSIALQGSQAHRFCTESHLRT